MSEEQGAEEQKAILTIKLIPEETQKTEGGVVIGSTEQGFDPHVTKREFNQYLVMNLDSMAQVLGAVIAQVEFLTKENAELAKRLKWLEDHDNTRRANEHNIK